MVRAASDRPVTFCIFLAFSFWPAGILTATIPTSAIQLDVALGVAIAISFTEAHARNSGRFRDVGAYVFWVYACLFTFGVAGVIVLSAIGPSLVTNGVPDLLLEAVFVFVVYATAWWLVYRDGYARIRPLNWGTSSDHSDG